MALSTIVAGKTLHTGHFAVSLCKSCSRFNQIRFSRYPKNYVEPIPNPEVFKSGALPIDVSTPVKAAYNDVSSSLTADPLANKFINVMMEGGKKEICRKIMDKTYFEIKRIQYGKFLKASEENKSSIELNPAVIFHQAIENSKPVIGLTSVKRGGKSYQVPTPLKEPRQRFLAMKWMITECKTKDLKTHMPEKLAEELLKAYENTGNVIKRKHDLHKMVESNRAYAHFRWW
ncbi:28S ribosomal protein S7, mitochondrial-like [Anneissia japonica]|uniref:28S ribosomal protein S7, mitochondrial-like n=1 Tax=Anneissia japonica TaxID=1529436 RepID=UPI0014256D5B|nr:28S ribosomal protein S7, mitochondrial-like [Anneissia japonica]